MKTVWTLFLLLVPFFVYPAEKEIIRLKNGDVLENATLGNDSSIIIEGEADVTISNCVIDTQKKVAIQALPGSGTVTIRNSRVTSRAGKGLYIESGRQVNISDCEISNCKEEGIDLRAAVKGVISGCSLTQNGESGIELIAGNSDLEIKNNNISENGASGLAIQFYSFNENEGRINLADNSFKNNQKYGIGCSIPEGKRPLAYYWNESINLSDNEFPRNALGIIEKDCSYTGPLDDKDEEILAEVAREFESASARLENNSEKPNLWQKIKNSWNSLLEIFY